MEFANATQQYEAWLRRQLDVIPPDLTAKHQRMAQDPFSFLRATFYRWVELWPAACPELAAAPSLLSVGDLHVENFGTWRDAEGRLVWGINDFDEAFPLGYPNDLVRLATSALLAIRTAQLRLSPAAACDAILDGYTRALKNGGCPLVLSERHRWLRDLATSNLRDPAQFWEKLDRLPTLRRTPREAMRILKAAMPEPGLPFRVVHRQAGLGSLGRPRFTALADWRGGKIAREIKSLLPSAVAAQRPQSRADILYEKILACSVRATDPFVRLRGRWLLRRLCPYCSRIELSALPRGRDEEKLMFSMGWETANIHLGSPAARAAVPKDLRKRRPHWLRQAADLMAAATLKDWRGWRATRS